MTGHRFCFDGDLSLRRNGKAGVGSSDDIDRFATKTAGKIEFADTFRQRAGRQHEKQRILADQHHNLHGLPALEVFISVNAAMLAFGNLTADGFCIVDLVAIRAEIKSTLIGILSDHAVRRADVACLVLLVVAGRRKLE